MNWLRSLGSKASHLWKQLLHLNSSSKSFHRYDLLISCRVQLWKRSSLLGFGIHRITYHILIVSGNHARHLCYVPAPNTNNPFLDETWLTESTLHRYYHEHSGWKFYPILTVIVSTSITGPCISTWACSCSWHHMCAFHRVWGSSVRDRISSEPTCRRTKPAWKSGGGKTWSRGKVSTCRERARSL